MLLPRLIPCLLLSDGALVKSVRFKELAYVGDPINAVRIFNQKEVDELLLLDIHATTKKTGIDFNLLEKIVSECFMPICYGGGVRSIDDMRKIFSMGIEKISLGAAAFEVPGLVKDAAREFGSQAIAVMLDVKRNIFGNPYVYIHNGSISTRKMAMDAANFFRQEGAGELIIYSIDRDGTWSGLDLDLVKAIATTVDAPIITTGGAGNFNHIRDAILLAGASGVAIGSMAVFQAKDMGVLIKFPSRKDQESLFEGVTDV